jgi:signal peptidase II
VGRHRRRQTEVSAISAKGFLTIRRFDGTQEKEMSAIRRLVIILATLIACVGCDQSTKHVARQLLQGRETISVMGDVLRLGYAENVGGFLGIGAALPEPLRTGVFLLLAALSLTALLAYAVMRRNIDLTHRLAVTLVVGGGFGNVVDRIANNGGVVDFLNVGIGSLRTGIFNVADIAIMLGAAVLLLSVATAHRRKNS